MFDIKKSEKAFISAKEHYIVVREGVVFLRVLGEEGDFKVLTATTGEDVGDLRSHPDQTALMAAARSVADGLDARWRGRYDFHNQAYLEICRCEYLSDVFRLAEKLFEKLDRPE